MSWNKPFGLPVKKCFKILGGYISLFTNYNVLSLVIQNNQLPSLTGQNWLNMIKKEKFFCNTLYMFMIIYISDC